MAAQEQQQEGEVESLSYGAAMEELEQILSAIERDGVELDELSAQVARASAIIQHCRGKIETTEMQVQAILAGLDGDDEGEGAQRRGEERPR